MTSENITKEKVGAVSAAALDACTKTTESKPISTYHEKIIGKTLYKVTTIYKGEIDFKKAMEDSIIRRIVNDILIANWYQK